MQEPDHKSTDKFTPTPNKTRSRNGRENPKNECAQTNTHVLKANTYPNTHTALSSETLGYSIIMIITIFL